MNLLPECGYTEMIILEYLTNRRKHALLCLVVVCLEHSLVEVHVVVVLGRCDVIRRFIARESDSVVTEVEFSVVAADEDISQDPQRSGRRRDV